MDDLYKEQVEAFKKLPGPLTIDHLDHMPLLHACVRETLRLRPPIMTIMRRAREDFVVEADGRKYVIPKGSQVCVSPTVNQRLPEEWDEPLKFDPYRFLKVCRVGLFGGAMGSAMGVAHTHSLTLTHTRVSLPALQWFAEGKRPVCCDHGRAA